MIKKRIRIISLIAAFFLLFSAIVGETGLLKAMAAGKIGTAVVTATTKLYTAKTGKKTAGTVAEGTKVDIYQKAASRWQVKKGSKYYWIDNLYLYDLATKTPKASDRVGEGVSTRTATVYTQPTTQSSVVKVLKKGIVRNLYAQSGNWYQIYTNGAYGWVRVDGFDYTKSVSRGRLMRIRTTEKTQAYYGPGYDFQKSVVIPADAPVNVYKISGSWALVYRSGKYLWVVNNDNREYAISYDLRGGVNSPDNTSYYTTKTITVLKAPTRSGYLFEGWYTDAALTNKENTIYMGSSGNKTFYAKWKTLPSGCTEISEYFIGYEALIGKLSMKKTQMWQMNAEHSYTAGGFYLEFDPAYGIASMKNEGNAKVLLHGCKIGASKTAVHAALTAAGWTCYSVYGSDETWARRAGKDYYLLEISFSSQKLTYWYWNNWPEGDYDFSYIY